MPSLATTIRSSAGGALARSAHPLGIPDSMPVRDASLSLEQYAAMVSEMVATWDSTGATGPFSTTWRNEPAERVGASMAALGRQAYKGSGLVFAIMGVRMVAFSLVRFQHQRMRKGRPTDMFATPALNVLQVPWPGGTTQDLLQRMILDVDLAGNSYHVKDGPYLMRLNPTWVQIILAPIEKNGGIIGYRKVGYTYHWGGIDVCKPENVAIFDTTEVAHFAPVPDPDAAYRGMSWLTACISEIENDKTMERHKRRFFENAATPNLTVSLDRSIAPEDFAKFKAVMESEHVGEENAYKTLYLGGGADVKVVGANFEQLQMNMLQGRGETRVASAGGVPPVIVGLSEGLSSATYSNYGQAMRRFADLTMASLWGNAAGSIATLINSPGPDTRLWYDTRDVSFLREDREVASRIGQANATTIGLYITQGFKPESAVLAVTADDPTLLEHTGLVSVQLQSPGKVDGEPAAGDAAAPADANASDSGTNDAPPTVADAKAEGAAANAADPAAGLKGQTPAEIRLLMEMIQKVYLGIGKVLTVEEARDLLNRAGADLPPLPPDSPLLAPPAPKPGPPGAAADPAADAPAADDGSGDSGSGDDTGTNSAPPPRRRAILPLSALTPQPVHTASPTGVRYDILRRAIELAATPADELVEPPTWPLLAGLRARHPGEWNVGEIDLMAQQANGAYR